MKITGKNSYRSSERRNTICNVQTIRKSKHNKIIILGLHIDNNFKSI